MTKMSSVALAAARRAWIWRNRNLFKCKSRDRLPRLLVDVSTIIRHDAQTGIQRVVRAIWSELAARSGTYFTAQPVYAGDRRGYCYAPFDFMDGGRPHLGSDPAGMGPGDKFLGLDLSAHVMPKYREQLQAWRSNEGSVHVVVYDLLPILRPDWFNRAATKHFRRWCHLFAGDVDQAICISTQVARDFAEQVHGSPGLRISRLQMGGDMAASRPSIGISSEAERVLGAISKRRAILMVGTVEPRKAYEVALSAFEQLWKRDPEGAPDLVIIGKSGWKTSKLQARILSHPKLGSRLHWLDRVSDEGLCRFYEAAQAVLVTSRAEGFGLPLMEAVAHGRPILARDLAVFREQKLPNVSYFSGDDPSELGARLMELVAAGWKASDPSPNIRSWSDSVDRLLGDIGIDQFDCSNSDRSLCIAS